MTGLQSNVYRVTYLKKSGREYSSLVSAVDAFRAIVNVQAYDHNICKVVSAVVVDPLFG